jgi:hypothetical protein
MISQQTLSRLLGYLPAQWDMIQEYMDKQSNLGDYRTPFSLFKSGMYKGHLTIKELKSIFGNKAATQFTVAEFMQATFLHTFVGGFINDSRKIVHNYTVGFLPSVNSDKNTIGQILIDLNLPCSRFEKSPRYFELTQDQIATLISEELGDSYKLTRDSINEDFAKLQQFVNMELGIGDVVLNPDHFIEFNKWANEHGVSAANQLFEWTQEYNHRYPNTPIKLTDQVHFIKAGNNIKANGTLHALIERYSSPTNVQKFLNIKRAEMFNALLNEGFQINLFSGENTSKAAGFLRDQPEFKDWVNHGNMVIGRIAYKGKQYKISSKVDLQEFQNETGLDVLSDVHAVSNTPGLSFELHPMLDKYNSLDYLFTQEFMIAGVGSHIAHPSKYKGDDPLKEEASRFLAQHKRNVSYTAAMHEYQLGQINGIPTEYNMAMMEDVPAWVYTMSGDMKDDADSFDGATFVNPWVIEWENNSLNSAKAGIDKKPFVHFYDERTHTGGIIKTAGFGVTNDRVRNYKFYRDMIFNMTHRPWLDEAGNRLKVTGKGILEDFNKRQVNYGPVYFFRDGKYYMRTIDSFVEGAQSYMVTDIEVDENGNDLGKNPSKHVLPAITSNYGIYQMFGGWNSMEIVDGKLQWSEKSRELTAMACNNYGFKRAGVVGDAQTADDVFQPMKHSDIHYMPTSGAVKQGIGNVNPHDYFFRKVAHADGYSNLNFMKVKMLQAGIQLDKEHHADNSVISLMT